MSTVLLNNESIENNDLLMFLYTIINRGLSMAVKVKVNDHKAKRDYGAKLP